MNAKDHMVNEIREYASILKEEIPTRLDSMNYQDIIDLHHNIMEEVDDAIRSGLY